MYFNPFYCSFMHTHFMFTSLACIFMRGFDLCGFLCYLWEKSSSSLEPLMDMIEFNQFFITLGLCEHHTLRPPTFDVGSFLKDYSKLKFEQYCYITHVRTHVDIIASNNNCQSKNASTSCLIYKHCDSFNITDVNILV